MRDIPLWLIIVLLIVGFIIVNKVYIPYKTVPITDENVYCENGTLKLKNDFMGIGKIAFEMEASLKCIEYKTSRCKVMCKDNTPVCQCEATILDQLISHEGEWIFR